MNDANTGLTDKEIKKAEKKLKKEEKAKKKAEKAARKAEKQSKEQTPQLPTNPFVLDDGFPELAEIVTLSQTIPEVNGETDPGVWCQAVLMSVADCSSETLKAFLVATTNRADCEEWSDERNVREAQLITKVILGIDDDDKMKPSEGLMDVWNKTVKRAKKRLKKKKAFIHIKESGDSEGVKPVPETETTSKPQAVTSNRGKQSAHSGKVFKVTDDCGVVARNGVRKIVQDTIKEHGKIVYEDLVQTLEKLPRQPSNISTMLHTMIKDNQVVVK